MIGGVTKHGRTLRDATNLANHLLKEEGVFQTINTVAPDLKSLMADMMADRDCSRADSAFLHIHLSPSTAMSRDDLLQASYVVLNYFGAISHPAAIVYHDKPRHGGEGERHAHLVVGRIGPDGKALKNQFNKMKLETACRLIEHKFGEAPTLGRHHKNSIKQLKKLGRDDVAQWLVDAHGHDPDKPKSAISPAKRQQLQRRGVEFSQVRDLVRNAWAISDNRRAFEKALEEQGLTVSEGAKKGVWLIKRDDIEVGSLARLLKATAKDVRKQMEKSIDPAAQPSPAPTEEYRGGDPHHNYDDSGRSGSDRGVTDTAERSVRRRSDPADKRFTDQDDGNSRAAPRQSSDAQPANVGVASEGLTRLRHLKISPELLNIAFYNAALIRLRRCADPAPELIYRLNYGEARLKQGTLIWQQQAPQLYTPAIIKSAGFKVDSTRLARCADPAPDLRKRLGDAEARFRQGVPPFRSEDSWIDMSIKLQLRQDHLTEQLNLNEQLNEHSNAEYKRHLLEQLDYVKRASALALNPDYAHLNTDELLFYIEREHRLNPPERAHTPPDPYSRSYGPSR